MQFTDVHRCGWHHQAAAAAAAAAAAHMARACTFNNMPSRWTPLVTCLVPRPPFAPPPPLPPHSPAACLKDLARFLRRDHPVWRDAFFKLGELQVGRGGGGGGKGGKGGRRDREG
jgi:hypothetical protein